MGAVDIIREEHTQVARLIACLEAVASDAEARGKVNGEAATELLFLFETFIDDRHQAKEEGVLFPELLRFAGKKEEEVLSKFLADHEQEVVRLSGMRLNVLGARYGEPGCMREFVREARAYCELQRRHMTQENLELLPMAERLLTPESDADVVRGFDEVDGMRGASPDGVRETIQRLCRQLGVELSGAGA